MLWILICKIISELIRVLVIIFIMKYRFNDCNTFLSYWYLTASSMWCFLFWTYQNPMFHGTNFYDEYHFILSWFSQTSEAVYSASIEGMYREYYIIICHCFKSNMSTAHDIISSEKEMKTSFIHVLSLLLMFVHRGV